MTYRAAYTWAAGAVAALTIAACSQSAPSQSPPPGTQAAPPAAAQPGADQGKPATDAPKPPEPPPAPEPPNAGAAGSGSTAATGTPAAKPLAADKAPAAEAREVTIPADTPLTIRLATSLASDQSKVEDRVRGSLVRPIVVNGVTVVPAGATVTGSVLEANESGRVKGRASLAFRFDRLTVGDEEHQIGTTRIAREAAADRKGDVTKGAIGGGAGAIVGGIIGGGKGAAIGAAAGGTGAVVATKGKEVRLPAGTSVKTTLTEPVRIVVPAAR